MAKKQGKPGVKKGQKVKTKRFSIQGFDVEHYKRTEQYAAAVQTLFDRATVAITNAAAKGHYDPDKPFSFADYPSVQAVMQKTIEGLANGVTAVIETGSRKQWLFANQKNDAFLASIGDTSKVSPAKMKKWQDKNLDALKAFQERKIEGMNLSQRVWKYVGQYKEQIELGLDVGLGEGRSAAQLARDVKENLREPNKLFRRVRDKHGNLHLSKAAKAYHPGQGVYRSSVKNAQRLTRSEINMAYRESDFLRWQNLDFVVGFEIHRSTHEPLCKCKLCERLVGRYPKTFKFKGWHPQCMCYATPILMDEETRNANEQAELKAALTGKPYKPKRAKNEVLDVPDGFKEWVSENVAAQENWASTPYFIADNFIDGQLSLGLKQGANDGGIKTIMQAIEVAKGFGIGHIDFGDATVEQANIILEALQEEFDYFGDAGIPLNGLSFAKGDMHTKKEGGHYNTQTNEMVINLDIFGDDADSGKPILEKIASLEVQKAKLQEQIMQFEAKLGINPAADKMLKQDIKQMKSRVTDIEIKIGKFQKDIAAGHDEITFTYAYSLKDVKDRVKATIHHEFGHLFDHKFNGGEGYAGNAYNSTYAKTTDQEQIAEWFSKWMMGDKEGIPQELLDAFENKTAVDTFKPQLMAIMPQIEQARQVAQEWGLSTAQIDVGIQNKNMHSITTGIEQIVATGQKLLEDVNAWIAKIMPLMQEAMKYAIPVSKYAMLLKDLQGKHSNWVYNKAAYTMAITEIQEAINEAKDNEQLSTLLVDVADAKAQFGSDAIHAVYDAVEKKLATLSNYPLATQKKELMKEIKYVGDPTFLKPHTLHSTWQVAQKAYQKRLDEVEYQLELDAIKTASIGPISFLNSSKSPKGKQLVSEFETMVQSHASIADLQMKLKEIDKFVLATQKRRKAAKPGASGEVVFDDEDFTADRKMNALWETKVDAYGRYDRATAHKFFFAKAVRDWARWSQNEREVAYNYTSGSSYINEPLYTTYLSSKSGVHGESRNSWDDINTLTDMIDTAEPLSRDVWLNRGQDRGAFYGQFGNSLNDSNIQKNPSLLVGKEGVNKPFTSCAHTKAFGFVGDGEKATNAYPVTLNIYCPKGTKCIYTEPYSAFGNCNYTWDGQTDHGTCSEVEVILQRGARLRITKAEYRARDGHWFIDCDLIGQPMMQAGQK